MKFNREELLQKLDVAKLAVDAREFVPILAHFCFHGKYITSYNDFIGVRVQCESNFKLALQADTLLKLLSSVRTDEVDIGMAKEAVFLKAGAARTGVRARLPYMGEEDFHFKWPGTKGLDSVKLSEKQAGSFLKGLRLCLTSVGDQMPTQMGVTLNQVGKMLRMYSTNNKAISKYTAKGIKLGSKNVILPTMFCQALLKAASVYGSDSIAIYASKNFYMVTFGEDAQCTVYGKLIGNADPLDFEAVISDHIDKDYKETRQAVPKDFREIFARAKLILSGDDLNKTVNVEVLRNTVSVEARSARGKVKSSSVFKKAWKGARTIAVDAELASKAVENCNEIYFGKRVMVFSQGTYMHMVMTQGE